MPAFEINEYNTAGDWSVTIMESPIVVAIPCIKTDVKSLSDVAVPIMRIVPGLIPPIVVLAGKIIVFILSDEMGTPPI